MEKQQLGRGAGVCCMLYASLFPVFFVSFVALGGYVDGWTDERGRKQDMVGLSGIFSSSFLIVYLFPSTTFKYLNKLVKRCQVDIIKEFYFDLFKRTNLL